MEIHDGIVSKRSLVVNAKTAGTKKKPKMILTGDEFPDIRLEMSPDTALALGADREQQYHLTIERIDYRYRPIEIKGAGSEKKYFCPSCREVVKAFFVMSRDNCPNCHALWSEPIKIGDSTLVDLVKKPLEREKGKDSEEYDYDPLDE